MYMKWIEYLEYYNIPFNIYILDKNDCIMLDKKFSKPQLMIILNGLIQLLQIFSNGETICTALLKQNNIISDILSNSSNTLTYYYKANAIIKTAIIVIPSNKLNYINNVLAKQTFNLCIQESRHNNNHSMIQILCHRNTKKRIIHLLLILSKNFGRLKNHEIIIPFYISHNTISIITGSQRVNVTRIMNYLKNKTIISYNKKNLIIHSLLQLIQS
uniref:Global nitrogen transcriptional regulator n=1 Tax=Corallina ferreyrae TaxID=2547422 RepID=A0A482CK06_9FLOR|nr:global nitrogen transcriptional regulator [Corallina ferreyrae]QBL75611.1 global nitrogen transcriptional regulator [Corallina ferreyrae]